MLFSPIFKGLPINAFFTGKGHAGDLKDIAGRLNAPIYLPDQRHTDRVVIIDHDTGPMVADAVITNRTDIFIGVMTADCAPILLFDKRRNVAGAVHAGWRGTAAGIVMNALRVMAAGFASSPTDILMAVGPTIGGCCYEVGPEVAEAVRKVAGGEDSISLKDSSHHIDLSLANRLQALSMGVPPDNIWLSGECTFCNPDKYYSYRYDKEAVGRQYAIAGIAR